MLTSLNKRNEQIKQIAMDKREKILFSLSLYLPLCVCIASL